MKTTYRLVEILNTRIEPSRIDTYGGTDGQPWKDTLAYPHLRTLVEDEYATFLVNVTDAEDYYPAEEFFHLKAVRSVTVSDSDEES